MNKNKREAKKLIKIEVGGAAREHYYLESDDECYYYGEYTARGGYACSPTNQTVMNLKKKQGDGGYHYKAVAIKQVAEALASGLKLELIQDSYTLIPVPPSKARDHEHFDDRMMQVLEQMGAGFNLDIRELVLQAVSTDPAHLSPARPSPAQLASNYKINESVALPNPEKVLIVDDVLTMGAHFKAVQALLRERYPDVGRIVGLFYARTVREDPVDDFDVLTEET